MQNNSTKTNKKKENVSASASKKTASKKKNNSALKSKNKQLNDNTEKLNAAVKNEPKKNKQNKKSSRTKPVSKKMHEVQFCTRILAALEKPIGIYFVSEDIYSLSSYFLEDLRDLSFFPTHEWQILPDDEQEARLLLVSRLLLGERSSTND